MVIALVEKNVYAACYLLRFSLDAAINGKKKGKKIYYKYCGFLLPATYNQSNAVVFLWSEAYMVTNAAVFCSPQQIPIAFYY